jgi:hypothetical protein
MKVWLKELESRTQVLFEKDGDALIRSFLGGNDIVVRELRCMSVPPGFRNRSNVDVVFVKELVEASYFICGVQAPDVYGGERNVVM